MRGVNHITREKNGVAHRLDKKTLSLMDEQGHMEECPLCIFDIITDERSNL